MKQMQVKEKVHELYELLEAMLDRLHEEDLAAELRAIEKDVEALVESLKRILISAQDK